MSSSVPTHTPTISQRAAVVVLLTTVSCGLLAFASTRFGWQIDGVAAVRLSSAWLLGILLLVKPGPRSVWVFVLLAWIAFTAGVHLGGQHPWGLSFGLGGARALEAALAYALFRLVRCDPAGLPALRDLGWLMLIALLFAPAFAGILAAGLTSATYGVAVLPEWRDWWVAGAFGMLSLLPLMLSVTPQRLRALSQPHYRTELALLALLTLAIALAASLWSQRPFVLLLLPLLLAAFRVGVLGTTALNLLTVLAMMALYRLLPLEQLHGLAALNLGEVAFYSALSLIPPLLLAVLHEQRQAAERALYEETERAQVTLDSIGDAVVVCDTDLRVTLLNPIAEDMTGWHEAEAQGRTLDEVLRLIDLDSGEAALSPLQVAIENNRIVALQLNAALERRDGMRTPIEDSAAPIHNRDGGVIGGVMVFHDVSESRAMALKMSHQAQHDYLTDLPNRILLQDRLAQALTTIARGGSGALLFIDLDHFKTINDSLGHQAGDHVLQEVARRLRVAVRSDDTVSRQGGDEFVVLLARLHDPRDAARVAGTLIEAMQAPVVVEGHRLHVGLSIGIALFPQDSIDSRELMKQADIALFHAKQTGRGRYSYFAASMSEKAEQRLLLEHELRDALRNDELFLVYQPKVTLPGGRITGMEALVRWRRPDGRIVPPLDFIPVAEESGLIVQVDEWVLRQACRQNKAWQDAGAPLRPVAVNVSLARFDPERLLALVAEVLQVSGLPPQFLEIEFTESQMFADQAHAWRLVEGLRALQVRIAVDDFGTGYSNLGYLAQYRFDTIKIDRSFITDLPNDVRQDAVVQAIIAMARALDARVVAEGVETRQQAQTLELHGCREIQGYLYSRPLGAHDFLSLLRLGALPEATGAENRDQSRLSLTRP